MPESDPIVSVVIPTCDRCEVLRRCLKALAQQTHGSFEIIIVDDCSTDGTPAMLEQFQADHPSTNIEVLRNDEHAGANPSRNRGVQASRGEFVAFLDSDCIAAPDWLERLLAVFHSDQTAAVTGRVDDPPPRGIYELAFKGTNRVHRKGMAHRLVAGNMCVRRRVLEEFPLDVDRAGAPPLHHGRVDTSVSGRGDEEGLYLMLRAAGYEIRTAPDAVVLHVHPMTRRSFFRQAVRGGRAAARLVYKYYLPTRIDVLPFILTYATLPPGLIGAWLLQDAGRWKWGPLAIPVFFFCGALLAIAYNDIVRKGKTIWETVRSLPVLLVYYHLRVAGYVGETLRLRFAPPEISRVRLCRPRK